MRKHHGKQQEMVMKQGKQHRGNHRNNHAEKKRIGFNNLACI